jgi:hypothetical protein
LDDFALCVARGHDVDCDDEELLAFEGGDHGGFIVVVYVDRFDAVGDCVCAALAGEGGDVVLACCDEGLGEVLPNGASSLAS